MRQKPLVLLDVDNTLFDANYRLTNQSIKIQIYRMSIMGWKIGLNSDTPLERLRRFAGKLNVTGPLIPELGGAIWTKDKGFLWEDGRHKRLFARFKSLFLEALLKRKDQPIITLSDASAVRAAAIAGRTDHDTSWLILHGERVYSAGFYALSKEARHLATEYEFDVKRLKAAALLAKRIMERLTAEEMWLDINPKYGICLIHPQTASKKLAAKLVLEKLPVRKIVMIGDSLSDWLDDPRIIQCAVANASEDYKRKCDFVAKQVLTDGAEECLRWADEQFK